METITKIQIQEAAKKLQNDKVSYTQALELVAKKYGFKTYMALKAVVFDKNIHNINPFNIEFDQEWLDSLIKKGIFNEKDRNDITTLCVSSIKPVYEYEINKIRHLKQHYNWFVKNPKSYAEKILNSLLIFNSNMNAPKEIWLREIVVNDFDLYYSDDVKVFTSHYQDYQRVRFRVTSEIYKIPFVEFNFKNKETTLYIKESDKNQIKFYEDMFSSYKNDFIINFSHIEAFPFYNVSKIVLIPYLFCKEGIEITKKGVKNINFDERHFNL